MSAHGQRGTAVVAALALVALGAALLASAAVAVSAGRRATLLERAGLTAESTARRVVAECLSGWDESAEQMSVGSAVEWSWPAPAGVRTGELSVQTHVRRERLGLTLYALSVESFVGDAPFLARRRVRLLVQRDTGAAGMRPVPIARWSLADLH